MEKKFAYHQLPEGYRLQKELNLSTNLAAKILLSLTSLVLFFLFWLFFIWLLKNLRPEAVDLEAGIFTMVGNPGSSSVQLLVLLLITFVMIFLHEGIHGLFFWLYTHQKPSFGFKVVYAYAGAPDWYISKWPYLLIGSAPLLVITIIGFMFLMVIPQTWIFTGLFLMTMNAAGAVGDIYAVFWLLTASEDILVQDSGEAVKIFYR